MFPKSTAFILQLIYGWVDGFIHLLKASYGRFGKEAPLLEKSQNVEAAPRLLAGPHNRVNGCGSPLPPVLRNHFVKPCQQITNSNERALLNTAPCCNGSLNGNLQKTKQYRKNIKRDVLRLQYSVLTLSPDIVHKTMLVLLYLLYPCYLSGGSVFVGVGKSL